MFYAYISEKILLCRLCSDKGSTFFDSANQVLWDFCRHMTDKICEVSFLVCTVRNVKKKITILKCSQT